MTTTIFYLIDFKEQEIYIFKDFIEQRNKEEELAKIYGANTWTLENGTVIQGGSKHTLLGSKKLKYYYGTVFVLYRFNETNTCNLHIEGRMKEINIIKQTRKVAFHKFKKVILIPYEEFNKKGVDE